MNACYFQRDKISVLGVIKAQLPFSEGKYQLLDSWNKIPFPSIFYHMNFQIVLSRTNITLKDPKTI